MRALLLLLFALSASPLFSLTCPNRTACQGMLQTQILAALPVWSAKLEPGCASLSFAGYPHCALVPAPDTIPTLVYGVTSIDVGTVWTNHAKASEVWPGVTADSVLGTSQQLATAHLATSIWTYGDIRGGGATPGCYVLAEACMQSEGGGDLIRVWYQRSLTGPLDFTVAQWGENPDTSKCAPVAGESNSSIGNHVPIK